MRQALAIALAGLLPAAASAQDLTVYGGAALTYSFAPDGRGSDDTQALEAYVEMDHRGLYLGVWAYKSSVTAYDEIDLYLGYRNETAAGLAYDLGYTRYLYPNDGGDCCGEITLALGYSPTDRLALSADAAYDPQARLGSLSVTAEYLVLPTFGVSATDGFVENGDDREWDVGGTWYIGDETALDLRYYDGSAYDSYVELYLSFDTTLFGG